MNIFYFPEYYLPDLLINSSDNQSSFKIVNTCFLYSPHFKKQSKENLWDLVEIPLGLYKSLYGPFEQFYIILLGHIQNKLKFILKL